MKGRHDELRCYLRVLKLSCGWTQIFDFSRNSLAYQRLLLKAQFIQHVNPLLWQQLTQKRPPHALWALWNLQFGHRQDLELLSHLPEQLPPSHPCSPELLCPHCCPVPFSAVLVVRILIKELRKCNWGTPILPLSTPAHMQLTSVELPTEIQGITQ